MIRSVSLRSSMVLVAGSILVCSLVVPAPSAWSSHGSGPHVSISPVSQLEGDADNPMTFTVTLDQSPVLPVTVTWETRVVPGGATAGTDFVAVSDGSVTFSTLETEKEISVTIKGDTNIEPHERFEVHLTGVSGGGAAITQGVASGTILNDDTEVSISDASVREGDSGTANMSFTVELAAISGQEVTVDFATGDGTATTADDDYQATDGTVTFPAGAVLRTITVPVNGDTEPEDDETFEVVLSDPVGVVIADGTGVGTILDEDAPPTIEAGSNRFVETAVSRSYLASVDGPDGIPLTVTWDFGDGTDPKTGNPVTHRFGAVGTFTVTATVSNGKGGEASDTLEVETFDTGAIGRLWGDSRVTTAIRASEANWPTSPHVLIALADKYPDALAAGPLATKLDAPLLLSGPSAMSAALERELHRLRAKTVWLLGGEGSLSAAIEQRLGFLGYDVERRSGSSRFETAATIAREVGPNSAREVVLTLGEHPDPNRAFPDALSAGSLSASPQRLPLLLTRTDDVPVATEQALSDLGTEKVWIVGGFGSVSSSVEIRLRALGYEVERLAGSSRYATSVAVAEEAMKRTAPGQVRVVFATGEKFPDGLTGGALAARVNGVLLLVPNGTLEQVTHAFVADHSDRFDVGVILGGSNTLSESVRLLLASLMKS